MQAILLSVDLFVRSVHYLSPSDSTLDAQSQKAICDAVNTILDVPSGTTTVTSYAALLPSDYDEKKDEKSTASLKSDSYRDVQVELRVLVKSLTANFRSVKLIDRDWLITYLGSVLTASAHDGELTSALRSVALASGSKAMLLANVTDAKVEYVAPSSPPVDEKKEQQSSSGSDTSSITLTQV